MHSLSFDLNDPNSLTFKNFATQSLVLEPCLEAKLADAVVRWEEFSRDAAKKETFLNCFGRMEICARDARIKLDE